MKCFFYLVNFLFFSFHSVFDTVFCEGQNYIAEYPDWQGGSRYSL